MEDRKQRQSRYKEKQNENLLKKTKTKKQNIQQHKH